MGTSIHKIGAKYEEIVHIIDELCSFTTCTLTVSTWFISNTLKHFISRREASRLLLSDNAKTYKAKELKKFSGIYQIE